MEILSRLMFLPLVTIFAGDLRVPGKIEGFPPLLKDNIIDGAIVIPSLRSGQILRFEVEALVAPNEEMKAGPKTVSVPGNFYLPRQSEKWGLFPVTLEKGEFGFYTSAGSREELAALSFRAPFSKMLDLGLANSPFTAMLPLVKTDRGAFGSERDWAAAGSATLPLDRTLQPVIDYTWHHDASPDPKEGVDLIVAFQATPRGRWIVSDLVGNPAVSGQVSRMSGLPTETRVLTGRLFNDANGNPDAVIAYLSPIATGHRNVSVHGLPPRLTGVAVSADRADVIWSPVSNSGWLAVFREGHSFTNDGLPIRVSTLEDWVDPRSGTFHLSRPLDAKEGVNLVFIGTTTDVPKPEASVMDDSDAPLFVEACEIRAQRTL